MAILLLLLAVIISVALFFMLAIRYGSGRERPTDVLDLDSIPEKREKQVLRRDDPEDLIV